MSFGGLEGEARFSPKLIMGGGSAVEREARRANDVHEFVVVVGQGEERIMRQQVSSWKLMARRVTGTFRIVW